MIFEPSEKKHFWGPKLFSQWRIEVERGQKIMATCLLSLDINQFGRPLCIIDLI